MNSQCVIQAIVQIAPICISILALCVSIVNNLQNKRDAFQNISAMLINQKTEFLNRYADLKDEEDEITDYVIKEMAANYCNSFENACALYLKNGIDKKLFESVFKEEIRAIAENHGVASCVDFPKKEDGLQYYENIMKVYEEFFQK